MSNPNVTSLTPKEVKDVQQKEKVRRLMLSTLSYLASKGNKDALLVMDEVQEIASKELKDLDPRLRALIQNALASENRK